MSAIMTNKVYIAFGLGFVSGYGISKVLSHLGRILPIFGKKQIIRSLATGRHKSPIYTRTGDCGQSSLYNGERRRKDDRVFFALGETDELNAVIGIAREHCEISKNGLVEMLAEIQSRLFDLGAAIATPQNDSDAKKIAYTEFSSQHTLELEAWIDDLDSQLSPLHNFVIPSGGLCSTHLNLARAVARRAERACICLVQEGHTDAEIGRYLNRLSDLLFVASRIAAKTDGHQELIWRKAKPFNSISSSSGSSNNTTTSETT